MLGLRQEHAWAGAALVFWGAGTGGPRRRGERRRVNFILREPGFGAKVEAGTQNTRASGSLTLDPSGTRAVASWCRSCVEVVRGILHHRTPDGSHRRRGRRP